MIRNNCQVSEYQANKFSELRRILKKRKKGKKNAASSWGDPGVSYSSLASAPTQVPVQEEGSSCFSKMVPKGSFHIRLLEVKVKKLCTSRVQESNLSVPSWPTWSSGPSSATLIYGTSQEWKWAPPRDSRSGHKRERTGLSKLSLCQRSPPPPGTFMYTFSSCFQLETCLGLTSENDFRFSLPRCSAKVS